MSERKPLPPLPIAEAAADIVYYERAAPFRPSAEVRLGEGFEVPGKTSLFTAPSTSLTIRNFKIDKAYLDTACMLLIKDGRKIPETAYLLPPTMYHNAQVLRDQLIELDSQTEYVIGCNLDHGYYHWLVQAIPAIDWAVRSRPHDGITLALPGMNAFRTASIELLGHAEVPKLHLVPHHHFYFPRVSHAEFLTEIMPFGISYAARSTFERLRSAVDRSIAPKAQAVYVARTDATRRVAINEQELVHALTAEGVYAIVPGSLPFAEQIALFKQADVVIGPHGAGLTNTVFCKPGAIVYELFPEHFINPCFCRLVQGAGLHYWADVFSSCDGCSPQERNWVIDIGVVLDRLRQIRKKLSETGPTHVSFAGRSGAMEFLRQSQGAVVQPDSQGRCSRGLLSRIWSRIRAPAD
jgi:hypothetical protein